MRVQGVKVKKGQIVCFVEQLGTFVPVEVRHSIGQSLYVYV